MFLSLKKTFVRSLIITSRNAHTQYIVVNENNGTREITLNHEKTKNSLSLDMMNHLIEAINSNKEDLSLRSIVLSAKGNIFSAGHNLKELLASDGVEQHKLIFNKATELMKSIIQSPVPVIAKKISVYWMVKRAKGPRDVKANFGIFCSTPGIAISRCVPKSRMMYMLLTGQPITAQEAYDSGLVTKVVPAQQLDSEVNQIIEQIKSKSRSVITLGKDFFYKQINLSMDKAYNLGEDVMVKNIGTDDGQEGIRSFVEKRKAHWSHK